MIGCRTGWTALGDSVATSGQECTAQLSYAVTVSIITIIIIITYNFIIIIIIVVIIIVTIIIINIIIFTIIFIVIMIYISPSLLSLFFLPAQARRFCKVQVPFYRQHVHSIQSICKYSVFVLQCVIYCTVLYKKTARNCCISKHYFLCFKSEFKFIVLYHEPVHWQQ